MRGATLADKSKTWRRVPVVGTNRSEEGPRMRSVPYAALKEACVVGAYRAAAWEESGRMGGGRVLMSHEARGQQELSHKDLVCPCVVWL